MDFTYGILATELTEEDLVLPRETRKQIKDVESWILHRETLLREWNLKKWFKPGYRVLFYGPSGTGKTLAATILGNKTGKEVYRVELNTLVSKYIGETEKNLTKLFKHAEKNDWILYFDEADALFGKRTEVRDAHDKYANQEVSYVLQRIELHNGLMIFASKTNNNIDEGFMRRMQSAIYFPPPDSECRFKLWKNVLPDSKEVRIPSDEEIRTLAKKYEITGAGIVNVVQNCCLDVVANKSGEITTSLLKEVILREQMKEGQDV